LGWQQVQTGGNYSVKAKVEVHLALHGKAGSHAANLFL
jgi:hypothetical protein